MADLQFYDAAAAGYARLIGPVSRHFIPFLLRAARVGLGMRVLDVATGTGLAAEAALAAVGLSGSVVAADISRAMVERARERLGCAPKALVVVEDGQSLTFADESFDAVLCSLGLMFFPDPAQASRSSTVSFAPEDGRPCLSTPCPSAPSPTGSVSSSGGTCPRWPRPPPGSFRS